jgi:hypothetical protein
VEIEVATVGVLRESFLEGAILVATAVLCLLVGCKGENDGLEWTGLVGRESERRTGLQKQDRCGKKNNGFCN